MRIIGGRFRGRKIQAPEKDTSVRPTADRTRESVFNMLLHRFQGPDFTLIDAPVVDVFAGTGAMGLEALSRGARHVTFIENGRAALAALQANIRAFGVAGDTRVIAADALTPPAAPAPCAVAFLDPPYADGLQEPALAALARQGWLMPGALAVVESDVRDEITAPEGFERLDSRRYGKARVTILRYTGLRYTGLRYTG